MTSSAESYPRDPAAFPRLALTLLAVVMLWPGLMLSELNPAALVAGDSGRAMARFLEGFWPPAHGPEFLRLLWRSTLETLAVATLGTTLAMVIALPASLMASRSLSISALPRGGRPGPVGALVRLPVRGALIFLRSVPEVVWALLLVRGLGLGPAAGVAAIAISYSGMLGKVYSEIYESVDIRPVRALLGTGSGRTAAFLYGLLPNALGEMLSYSLYRWECALRASVIMGFVGAGGLGQQIQLSLRMFAGDEVASIVLVFMLLVLGADILSWLLRRGLA